MNLRLAQIVLSLLFIVSMDSRISAGQRKTPEYQVYVYVSDGSFLCPWCDRFKSEVLADWKKKGWPIGTGKSNHIRMIPCVSGPVPYFEIYRKGELTAKHTGFLDRAEFRAFTEKYIPEWYQREKRETSKQKLLGTTTPPPKYWNYQSRLLLGD